MIPSYQTQRHPVPHPFPVLPGLFAGLAIAVLFPGFLLPQEQEALPVLEEQVEVVADSRSLQTPVQPLIVLDRETIRRMAVSTWEGLLDQLGPITVQRRGPGDASFDLSLFGSNFEGILILLNGMPVNHPQTGHFSGDLPFDPQDIERIEILPAGIVPFGSGAYAGALNIILRRDKKPAARAELGQHGLAGISAGMALGIPHGQVRLSGGYLSHSGFDPGTELERGRASALGFWASGAWQIQSLVALERKKYGAQGFYAPLPSREEGRQHLGQVIISRTGHTVLWETALSSRFYRDIFDLDRTRPAYYHNESTTRMNQALLRARSLPRTGLFWECSMDLQDQHMDSLGMGQHKRILWGGQFRLGSPRSGRFGLEGSLRLAGDGHASPLQTGLGAWADFSPTTRLTLGFSQGERLPSFTEQFYQSPANTGNPGLLPERSLSLNLNASHTWHSATTNLLVWTRFQKDVIDWIRPSGNPVWLAVNHPRQDLWGALVNHTLFLPGQTLRLAVEYTGVLQQELSSSQVVSKYGLRFTRWRLSARHDWLISPRWSTGSSLTWRELVDHLDQALDLTLHIERHLRNLDIGIALENALNQRLEAISGILGPGRTVSLRFRWTP